MKMIVEWRRMKDEQPKMHFGIYLSNGKEVGTTTMDAIHHIIRNDEYWSELYWAYVPEVELPEIEETIKKGESE